MDEEEGDTDNIMPSDCEKIGYSRVAYEPLENKQYHWNKKEKFKWMITFFVGNILLYSARSVMSICVPVMSKELGWNKVVSGMVLSSFFCGYLCTNMIGGHFADKMGGEVVICYAGIGWAFLTTTLPFIARSQFFISSSTIGVIMTRFVTGLSQGVFYPSMSAITSCRITSTEKGSFTGFTFSGASVGSALTGLFGSIILEKLDWSLVFIIVGSLSILWILWLRYLISFQKPLTFKRPVKPKHPFPFRKLFTNGPFWGLFVAYFTASYCFLNMLSWTPVYFHDSFPSSEGWLFNTAPWILSFVLSNIAGSIANRLISSGVSATYVRKLFASFQLLGYCFSSISINYVGSFYQALFFMSLNISANAFSNCSLALNPQDLAPSHAGALYGFMNGSGAVAGVIGVYLTGYILKVTGKWSLVFMLNAFLTFIGWVSFMLLGSGVPQI